ncbi:MAG: hypothetical protein RL244_1599 [Pseudomonadota bacterium]|uniref:ferredoxin reductase family protein n=1 Tax=Brachymonas denitrificans TaxID=28220 RepID=UPI0032202E14
MTRIRMALWGSLVVLTGLWLLADTLWPQPFGYFPFRTVFMQYSGVIAFGAMTISMVLATRPKWLERPLDGLDKMYRLHKWLGITALVTSVVHWWWAQGTKWMVGWGWLVRPARGPQGGPGRDGAMTLEHWLRTQRGLAESLGEWAFYAALILMVLALIKRFPYHWFARTHKWLAAAYLVLAWHTLVLFKYDYWSQPIGWVMALMLVAGTVSAVLVLLRKVGAGRKVEGTVESLRYFEPLQVLRTSIRMQPGWKGHQAGQFAFVQGARDLAHPFTMASSWDPVRQTIVFVTKALGDHTSQLHEVLREGDTVTVEGPYGCFTFDDDKPRQIWIGAGIGITPFIARMQQMARDPEARKVKVDLFHPTADYDENAIAMLEADALAAGVRLHVLVDKRDGLLTGERMRQAVPDWEDASLWFCGPTAFGRALRADFVGKGIRASDFHQELFAMR